MSKLFVIESSAKTMEEALKITSTKLLEEGCVKNGFYESCLEREREYPTGLTDYCPVALPHTCKDYVKEEAICVLRLNEPVKFRSMEDIEKEIDVRIVMNMALLDDDKHIVIISRIIRNLKNTEFVRKLKTLELAELEKFLNKSILILQDDNENDKQKNLGGK